MKCFRGVRAGLGILSAVMLLCLFSCVGFAAEDQCGYIPVEEELSEPEDLPDYLWESVTNGGGISLFSLEDTTALVGSASVTDSYYHTELLPSIREQGASSACWAFSAIACMEINLLKKGLVDQSVDLSEAQLVYFSYNNGEDPLGGLSGDTYKFAAKKDIYSFGGNYLMATNALMDWNGAVAEVVAPFSMTSVYSIKGMDSTYASEADIVQLQGYQVIPMSNQEAVKQAILDYGSVQITYYSLRTESETNAYYNSDTAAYYCNRRYTQNHGVTIVGWDDDFSSKRFNESCRPSGDGAWIVRNSWGTGYGEAGYFYLSYYDATFGTSAIAYDAVLKGTYDYNYQYDGILRYSTYSDYSSDEDCSYANVFVAHGDAEEESLEAVAFHLESAGVPYELDIYTGVDAGLGPDSGTHALHQTGTTLYSGYETYALDTPVMIKNGESFSVVLTIPASCKMAFDANASWGNVPCTVSSSNPAGQSFLGRDGAWADWGEMGNGSLHIKAYTVGMSEDTFISPTSITVEGSTAIQLGRLAEYTAEVGPENVTNNHVHWSVDSQKYVHFRENNGTVSLEAYEEGTTVLMAVSYNGAVQKRLVIKTTADENAPETNSQIMQGWIEKDNAWYYYVDNIPVTGWQKIGVKYYCFDAEGKMVTGWVKYMNRWYYLNSSGSLRTNAWLQSGDAWYYFTDDGTLATGWKKVGGAWYYFRSNGDMYTGWLPEGDRWYYLKQNGAMATGWEKVNGKWYYFRGGIMQNGWQKIGTKWYYFNDGGDMVTGWKKLGTKWYYFNAGGDMVTGWKKLGTKWYYLNVGGDMVTGWKKLGTKWYYFNADGSMVVNTTVNIGGRKYSFDSNGAMK